MNDDAPRKWSKRDNWSKTITLQDLGRSLEWRLLRVNAYLICHEELTEAQRRYDNRPSNPRPQLVDHHIGRIVPINGLVAKQLLIEAGEHK